MKQENQVSQTEWSILSEMGTLRKAVMVRPLYSVLALLAVVDRSICRIFVTQCDFMNFRIFLPCWISSERT